MVKQSDTAVVGRVLIGAVLIGLLIFCTLQKAGGLAGSVTDPGDASTKAGRELMEYSGIISDLPADSLFHRIKDHDMTASAGTLPEGGDLIMAV